MSDFSSKEYWLNMVKMSLSRYFVLYALMQKPMHGYEICKWLGELTKDCCTPTEGGIYPMLKEFEESGCVTSQITSVSGRERKVYTLSVKGKTAFKTAAEIWGFATELIQESINN